MHFPKWYSQHYSSTMACATQCHRMSNVILRLWQKPAKHHKQHVEDPIYIDVVQISGTGYNVQCFHHYGWSYCREMYFTTMKSPGIGRLRNVFCWHFEDDSKIMTILFVIHTMDKLWEKFHWIPPLYMKRIDFQSKASVVCSVTTALFIDFCLKKLNVFSQHIGTKTNEYLDSTEKKLQGIETLIYFLC